MSEKCWCGKSIHYCDDGLPDGRVACDCATGHDHMFGECGYCNGYEVQDHKPKAAR